MTFLGIPGMFIGFNMNMSCLAWRKSTSAPSYLLESDAPMRTRLDASTTSIETSFVSSTDLKAPEPALGASSAP
jgi:hypothetical protein